MQCEKNSDSETIESTIPISSKILDKKRKFKCSRCDYHAEFPSVVRKHAVIHSAETKKHACSIPDCNFRTNLPSNLRAHVRRRHEEVLKPDEIRSWNFCTKCDFRTKEPVTLKRHSFTHEETKPFACSFEGCTFRSYRQSSIHSHERRRHHPELKNRFTCSFPLCEFGSYAKNDLQKHMLTHSDDRPFACFFPGCSYKGKQAKDVTNHQKKVHDPDRVKEKECTFCAKKFFTDNALSTHIKAHLDEKPYSCPYPNCNVRRVHKSAIKQHEITHRNEKNVHCDHPGCKFKTKNATRLRMHKKIHELNRSKNYQCILCSRKFYTESTVQTHMLSHTQEKPYKCPNCDYSTPVAGRLKFHRCFRHNPQLRLPTKSSASPANNDEGIQLKHKCELCDYSTRYFHKVKEHIMTVHIERLEDVEDCTKRYKCRECDRISDCLGSAKTHCRTHSKARPFKCTFGEGCDFQARLIRQLQKHMREAHKAERVLPTAFCTECKREISLKNWNLHLKSHSSGPYNCNICGYKSRFPSRLFTHISSKLHQKNLSSLAFPKQWSYVQ